MSMFVRRAVPEGRRSHAASIAAQHGLNHGRRASGVRRSLNGGEECGIGTDGPPRGGQRVSGGLGGGAAEQRQPGAANAFHDGVTALRWWQKTIGFERGESLVKRVSARQYATVGGGFATLPTPSR